LRPAAWAVFGLTAGMAAAQTTELKPATVLAFDSYIQSAESRIDRQMHSAGGFLWVDQSSGRAGRVRAGAVLSEPWAGKPEQNVPDGLIHDWIGAVFIPGATLDGTLAFVQDYNNHKNVYKPEVLDSKLLSRQGGEFRVYLRLLKKKIITVTLDTYYDVRYVYLDPKRCYSRSRSTRIAELTGARELPVGRDHGFLWRLYSYWRFEERDGGVYMECEAISLTRNVPRTLGWLIEPIIRDLPRESLASTLRETALGVRDRPVPVAGTRR
jgi:hypothetical protein